MLEILRFIFQGFWHFVGFAILLGIVTEMIVRIIRGYPPCDDKEDGKTND